MARDLDIKESVTPVRTSPHSARQQPPAGAMRKSPVLKGKDLDAFERKAASPPPLLQRGSTGPRVRALQERLVKAGFMGQAEVLTGPGVFGPRTEQAVRRFQESVSLVPTGVAGPTTMAALTSGTKFCAPQEKDITATQPIPVAEMRRISLENKKKSGAEDTAETTSPMVKPPTLDF